MIFEYTDGLVKIEIDVGKVEHSPKEVAEA